MVNKYEDLEKEGRMAQQRCGCGCGQLVGECNDATVVAAGKACVDEGHAAIVYARLTAPERREYREDGWEEVITLPPSAIEA